MDILSSPGLVEVEKYLRLEDLELYKTMENYSNKFLLEHKNTLKAYSGSWVADPFHQWSRRWEYPWTAHQLASLPAHARILDAGSGITFFPFYLSSTHPSWQIHCLDYDPRLTHAYKEVSSISSSSVHFKQGTLQKINYDDHNFDALYCISVLEHTDNYDEIARQLYRVLKPGGLALVTIDICLNGVADISPAKARELVAILEKYFIVESESLDLTEARTRNLVRTKWIRSHRPESLPWKFPMLSALKAGVLNCRFPRFIDLTFCNLRLTKK